MRLADLLPEYSLPKSHADLTTFGVTDDSREVRFGFLFCALPLSSGNGLRHCAQAAVRGAQVVIVPEGTPDSTVGLTDFEKSKVIVLHQSANALRSPGCALSPWPTRNNGCRYGNERKKFHRVFSPRPVDPRWFRSAQPWHFRASVDRRAAQECRGFVHDIRYQIGAPDRLQPRTIGYAPRARSVQPWLASGQARRL
jgi:hypothetical protein